MNKNEILKNIKKQFARIMFASNATTPFTTTDGKNLLVMGDDLAVGTQIVMVADDNTQMPLAAGDYTLQDGRTITVKMDGDNSVIDAVVLPDAPKADTSPEGDAKMDKVKLADGMPDGQENSKGATEEDIKADGDVESRLSALENQIAEILNMLSGTMDATEKMMSAQFEAVKTEEVKFAKQPGGTAIKTAKKFIEDGFKAAKDVEKPNLDGMREQLALIQKTKLSGGAYTAANTRETKLQKVKELAQSKRKDKLK